MHTSFYQHQDGTHVREGLGTRLDGTESPLLSSCMAERSSGITLESTVFRSSKEQPVQSRGYKTLAVQGVVSHFVVVQGVKSFFQGYRTI